LVTYTQTLTIFLASYLGLGLLFGAFSVGVITSRAVVERRQLIGMLRALGFSRLAVGGLFLLETSFLITLSQLVGSVLAWWLVLQVASQFARNVPIPLKIIDQHRCAIWPRSHKSKGVMARMMVEAYGVLRKKDGEKTMPTDGDKQARTCPPCVKHTNLVAGRFGWRIARSEQLPHSMDCVNCCLPSGGATTVPVPAIVSHTDLKRKGIGHYRMVNLGLR
jgi:hypothetical protein